MNECTSSNCSLIIVFECLMSDMFDCKMIS